MGASHIGGEGVLLLPDGSSWDEDDGGTSVTNVGTGTGGARSGPC
jgi:hypothetical protein